MNLSGEFIALDVELYLSFGLSRSFDPDDPVWRAYVAGVRPDSDPRRLDGRVLSRVASGRP